MIGDWLQLGHYAISVGALLLGIAMLFLKDRFVTREEHESQADEIATKVSHAEFAAHRDETNRRLGEGSARMAELSALIGRVDAAIRNLPTKEDLHDLALALKEVGGDLKAIRAEARAHEKDLSELRDTVTRHEDIIADARRSDK